MQDIADIDAVINQFLDFARVTSDVDQVSQFLVFGGLLFVVSIGQVVIATAVMLIYSWQLTLVVWLCFAPLFASLKFFQRKLSQA
mgnify:CR=1 FL=1